MSDPSVDQRLFKLILGAIASDSLSAEDYRVALTSLQSGQLVGVLETILSALATNQPSTPAAKNLNQKRQSPQAIGGTRKMTFSKRRTSDDLFDDVKRRKLTRDRLDQILQSLDSEFFVQADRALTMRALIKDFYEHSTDRQWTLFSSIVNGEYENDPYLNADDVTR